MPISPSPYFIFNFEVNCSENNPSWYLLNILFLLGADNSYSF